MSTTNFFWGTESITDTGERYPVLTKHSESSVPGLFCIGNIAGTPDLKHALKSGFDLATHLRRRLANAVLPDGVLGTLIIGGGAAGVNAAIELKKAGIAHLLIERQRLFGTIRRLPRTHLLYAVPAAQKTEGELQFNDDCLPGELLKSWDDVVLRWQPSVSELTDVVSVVRKAGDFVVTTTNGVVRTRTLVLAVGKTVLMNQLEIGEDRFGKIHYDLGDAAELEGSRVLIIGGTDDAAEAALRLSERNRVVMSYRSEEFRKVAPELRAPLADRIADGTITAYPGSRVVRMTEAGVMLRVSAPHGEIDNDVPCDRVYPCLGIKALATPKELLSRLEIKVENEWGTRRYFWLVAIAVVIGGLYVMKEFGKIAEPFRLLAKELPFLKDVWAALASVKNWWFAFERDVLGFHLFEGYALLYTTLVVVFGIIAMRRYRKYAIYSKARARIQLYKYLSLIAFQTLLFWLIPEIIAKKSADPTVAQRYWHLYQVAYGWPLSLNGLTVSNSLIDDILFNAKSHWPIYGLTFAFLLIPVFSYFKGKMFCSWICGCGALAETVGDRWRHLAPKGARNVRREWVIWAVFWAAVAVTLFYFLGAYGKIGLFKTLYRHTRAWYDLVVDLFLIGAIPLVLYPFMGGKVWCRFWCPLAIFMQWISKRGRYRIETVKNRCIACGMCNRYCEVGIDVRKLALTGDEVSNRNTSCIGCGVCITVCPTEALVFGRGPRPTLIPLGTTRAVPH